MTEDIHCPFCGSTERITESNGAGYCVCCLGCGASGPMGHTMSEALELWGKKIPGPESEDLGE